MRRTLGLFVVLLALGFAAEVVTFDGNWAPNPLFNVVSQGPNAVEVIFSTHEVVIEEMEIDGVTMKHFGIPGIFLPNDAGAPNLAGTGRYIAVPEGARVQVTVLDVRTEVIHGIDILPAPELPLDTDDSPLRYEKDMSIYGRNAYYPDIPVQVSEVMEIRGVDIVVLGITPFQYNPVTRELIVYKDIRCRVDFIGGNGHFGEDRLRSRFWESTLQGHLLNYVSLPEIDFYAPERISDQSGYEYIIIVPDDAVFEAWADTIKSWRKLQGISCEVFTLTEVGGSTSGAIESFLNNAYNTWNPAPAGFLLLSDYPTSGDAYGITSPMWAGYCVSDNIYADVSGNNLPDMHHGRITAQTETQLNRMINKFLSLERDPYTATNFYDNPLVACGWQTERWFQLCSEVIRGFWINSLGKDPSRQYNVYSGTPYVGCSWSTAPNTATVVSYFSGLGYIPTTNPYNYSWWDSGSATGVNNDINSGAFIVQHRDHGNETGWGEPAYNTGSLNGLTNTMYPYVFSCNCLTGIYNWTNECFAEKFHRIEHGALGINAATEVSYSFVNDTYQWGIYDCLWPQFMPGYPAFDMVGYSDLRPGPAMSYGKIFLYGSSWPYNAGSKIYTYHLFHHHGDVFMTLYSEMPQTLSVSHATKINANQSSFTVTANDSSVIAITVDGEIIGVAEGTGSALAVPITAQPAGVFATITITKANFYRYEVTIPVVPSNYAYVIDATKIIDDGGDGLVNPGENINFGVYGWNMGTQNAQSVYGLLSEADPYVTINSDSSWFGTIVVDDSVLSNPYYEFVVANNCPDGHILDFTFEFHDTNDTVWVSDCQLLVYAPVLTYQHVIVLDANGVLEPGETSDMAVRLRNDGSATAESVTSTLMSVSSFITINDASGGFGNIDPGDTASNVADPYTVTASSSAPHGVLVDFSVVVQAGVYIDTLDFSMTIGNSVPTDTGYYYVYYSSGPHTRAPVFDWFPIDTTQTANAGVSIDPAMNQTIQTTLPFTFQYYGQDYNDVSICSNGWIALGSETATDFQNTSIPNAAGPEAMVAGVWDDFDPGDTLQPSDVYYYNDAANHRFVIEYFRMEHRPSGNHETFEIMLYDPAYYPTPTGDGEIIVQYLVGMQIQDNTVGIENFSETVGVQYFYNGTYDSLSGVITDSFALKYTTYPPENVGIEETNVLSLIPIRTLLNVLYPNPGMRLMSIRYQVAHLADLSLCVYDAAGRLVRTIVDGACEPGYYTQVWDAKDDMNRKVPAGVYFVRFQTGDYQRTEKAILLR